MAISQLLNQTVTLYARGSYDAFGREVVGSGTSYRARVQEVTKSKLLPNGQQVTIDAIVYLNGSPSISANDRLDYNGVKYKIFGKSVGVDGQGNSHHTKLELIKWTHN